MSNSIPVSVSVSVAMCTRDGERFIEDQIRSILGQSVRPSQIVISDDASSDETVALVTTTIATWRVDHPEAALDVVRLHNPRALGVAENFARAIAACTGELVALSDQDDVWSPHRLERMVGVFESRPELILLHTDAKLIDAEGRTIGPSLFDSLGVGTATRRAIHSGRAFEVLMKRNIVTGATTVFRRRVAHLAAPFPPDWIHDEWLAIVASIAGEVDLLEEALVQYRQHSANEIGAERLGLIGMAGRMLENGTDRNRRLLARSEQLAMRISGLPASAEQVAAVGAKLAHERVRANLGRKRVSRVMPILREFATGRYGSFGRGIADAARDLLQPLGAGV